jgi:hypothetical protein
MLKGKLGTSARVFGLWDGLNLTNKSLMKTFSELRMARRNDDKELRDLVYCGERWLLLKNGNYTKNQQRESVIFFV